jgi:hypothetical protein
MDILRDFLRELAGRPFAWGEFDCAFSVAVWVERVTGRDPVPEWRGTYSTAEECRALLEREGGLARLICRIAKQAGARPTRVPQPGDFGVIHAGGQQFAVIMTPSGRWAGKGEQGVVSVKIAPRVAWTLRPC